ncbi:hypothetical protein HK102_002366 [Quaeritorhiza haematococci]|nr:hypothetical protein HK102_002366 [Quaeritorhiza haematococci]
MDVCRDNFGAQLESIKAAIANCDFIAIDLEFTGLSTTPHSSQSQINSLDTHQERYAKIRDSASAFQIVQYGVCPFIWDQKKETYVAKPFNIYVFPLPPANGQRGWGLDRAFYCQASTLEFLKRNGFDFNKWITQGVPYASREEEERIRRKTGTKPEYSDIPIDDSNREFVESSIAEVKSWLQNSNEKTYVMQPSTSYHRRLVHQEVRKEFNGFVATASGKTPGTVEMTRLTSEERRARLTGEASRIEDDIMEVVGARRIIDAIASSGKPVVGHNMFLDLAQTMHHFVGPLPTLVEDFKKALNRVFPIIYDTKYLASNNSEVQPFMTNTALSELWNCVSRSPFDGPAIEIHKDFANDDGTTLDTENSFHEAGYDAYVTGFGFLRMLDYIATRRRQSASIRARLENPSDSAPTGFGTEYYVDGVRRIRLDSDMVREFRGKLFLMRSDLGHLYLEGEDATPDRSNIFHVSEFPATTSTFDIITAFRDVGPVQVRWIDSTSCWVIVRETENVAVMIERFVEKKEGKGIVRGSDDDDEDDEDDDSNEDGPAAGPAVVFKVRTYEQVTAGTDATGDKGATQEQQKKGEEGTKGKDTATTQSSDNSEVGLQSEQPATVAFMDADLDEDDEEDDGDFMVSDDDDDDENEDEESEESSVESDVEAAVETPAKGKEIVETATAQADAMDTAADAGPTIRSFLDADFGDDDEEDEEDDGDYVASSSDESDEDESMDEDEEQLEADGAEEGEDVDVKRQSKEIPTELDVDDQSAPSSSSSNFARRTGGIGLGPSSKQRGSHGKRSTSTRTEHHERPSKKARLEVSDTDAVDNQGHQIKKASKAGRGRAEKERKTGSKHTEKTEQEKSNCVIS